MNRPNNLLHSDWFVLICVLSFAFIIRSFYLSAYLNSVPNAIHPANDAKMYWDLGRTIYQEGWLLTERGPYYQAPLYPYFLAALHHAGFHTIEQAIRLQIMIGVANVLLCYCIARLFLKPMGAGAAALLFACSPLPLFCESKTLAATLGLFLFLSFFLTFCFWIVKNNGWYLAASSLLYGLAVLCRPNLLFTLPPLVFVFFVYLASQSDCQIYELFKNPGVLFKKLLSIRLRKEGVLFLAVFTAMILPVTIRNIVIGGDFIPICANSGVTLYMGTNPLAQGGLAPVEGLSNDIAQQCTGSVELASQLAGRPMKPSEASAYWIGKTIKWVIAHPLQFIILECKKILWAFYYCPPAVNYSSHFEGQWIPWLGFLHLFTWLALAGAIAGAPFVGWSRSRLEQALLAAVGGYLLLCVVYYSSDRFLAGILPFLTILAVLTIQRAAGYIRESRWIKQKIICVVWIVCAVFVTANPFFIWNAKPEIGIGWYNLGVFFEEKSRELDALNAYEQSLSYTPDFPSTLLNLGVLYAKRNNLDESNRLFERVLAIDPNHPTALRNVIINYQKQGRTFEAQELARRLQKKE